VQVYDSESGCEFVAPHVAQLRKHHGLTRRLRSSVKLDVVDALQTGRIESGRKLFVDRVELRELFSDDRFAALLYFPPGAIFIKTFR
jgi:hypothetical protein